MKVCIILCYKGCAAADVEERRATYGGYEMWYYRCNGCGATWAYPTLTGRATKLVSGS